MKVKRKYNWHRSSNRNCLGGINEEEIFAMAESSATKDVRKFPWDTDATKKLFIQWVGNWKNGMNGFSNNSQMEIG